MIWWKRLKKRLSLLMHPERHGWLYVAGIEKLQIMARYENRPPTDLARDLLHFAIADIERQQDNQMHWQSLTEREKQVAALICANLTSEQIGRRLHLSEHTVRHYAKHVLDKFRVASRGELRSRLAGWDFGEHI